MFSLFQNVKWLSKKTAILNAKFVQKNKCNNTFLKDLLIVLNNHGPLEFLSKQRTFAKQAEIPELTSDASSRCIAHVTRRVNRQMHAFFEFSLILIYSGAR